jgi:hypothetical protein
MGALTEHIFSHAVALQQSGRLRNTIFVHKRDVYILNYDYTVILKFQLPSKEPTFDHPVAFAANDYESSDFHEEDGMIIFKTKDSNAGLVRTKTCAGVELSFENAAEIFETHYGKMDDPKLSRFSFKKTGLSFLEENLSHLELKARDGKWLITQRDIYSGSVIEIEKFQKGLGDVDDLSHDFGPIGIRTNDFLALYNFNDSVMFHFPSKHTEVCLVKGDSYNMKGIIAGCLYDELGAIETIKEKRDGRKEQKNRRREQKADPAVGEGTLRRRRRRRR